VHDAFLTAVQSAERLRMQLNMCSRALRGVPKPTRERTLRLRGTTGENVAPVDVRRRPLLEQQ